MLHRLVKTAVRDLHEYLQVSVDTAQELADKEEDHAESDDSDADSLAPRRRTEGEAHRRFHRFIGY